MNKPFVNLDLMMLSKDDNAAVLDNEFMMNDNLYVENGDDITPAFEFSNYPIKLSFTINIFCLAGSIHIRLNLKEFIMRPNDILIALPGSIGEFYNVSSDARIAFMAHTGDYFQFTNHVTESMSLQSLLRTNPLCHIRQQDMDESMKIYHLMKAKIEETDNPFRKGALQGYTQVLTYNAYKHLLSEKQHNKTATSNISRQQEIFDLFMEEVRKHYVRERSISFYANQLCVTPKYLSHVVHSVSGHYAGEWINDFVILEAKALIKSRKYTMQQISDMLNFANSSFFGKYFKESVGCSPTTYQKMD